ncbi:phosphotransferase [Deinococcus multiflagellatus]|uniref:Phosphotransferase n=1 Tax=Deinococcus multiflagellatus TaxID=1656887 RepID=A0ABW1ZI39_9DEIO|nr:phosphotransferase [Deinococcus multiflagellatus]MBZ9713105.1 phosphotransferase [Deinococcus multiflagellatus]
MAPEARAVALWHAQALLVWRTPEGGWPQVLLSAEQPLEEALSAALGPVWLLHDGGHLFGQAGLVHVQALGEGTPTGGGGWRAERPPPIPNVRRWQRPGWPATVNQLAGQLLQGTGVALDGAPHLQFASDLSATHLLATSQGRAWLKVSDSGREAALTTHLWARHPELLPPVLAADPARGALLTQDGGALLDGAAALDAWTEALTRLARFQRTADAGALAAAGAPALPLQQMTEQVDALLGDRAALRGWNLEPAVADALTAARPRLRAALRDLQLHGLPDLPAHGDAHPRNALHSAARGSVWFDWSEAASATHPFMDAGWFLAFALHPSRAALPVWQAHPDAAARMGAAYLRALDAADAAPLLWRALPLALLHRAAVYDATFRTWTGTVPGTRPNYVPYYLRQAARELQRLT